VKRIQIDYLCLLLVPFILLLVFVFSHFSGFRVIQTRCAMHACNPTSLSIPRFMEIRLLELPLRAFGAQPTAARVELDVLTPSDRLKRAATILGISLIAAVIALPIPLVHLVFVPGVLLAGIVLSIIRLRQGEIFRSASGSCPYCATEQKFTVMGTFRLPKTLHCQACQRQLVLEGATT
jgi:hypothetical protein